MKKIALICAAVMSACNGDRISPLVPEDWHVLPERAGGQPSPGDEPSLGNHVDLMLGTYAQTLGELPLPELKGAKTMPWHLEYFITDLSVSASGVLGALTSKGTPSVSLVWRRQYQRADEEHPEPSAKAELVVSGEESPADLARQLEPAIRAAVLSGKVTDESALRRNLLALAGEFREVVRQLASTPQGEWWVSRFRMEAVAELSGQVTPEIGAGGDVRFRFEWFRAMKKAQEKGRTETPLARLVSGMIEDLSQVALEEQEFQDAGFKAYGYKLGVGLTAKGEIAVGKASSTVMGQLYFSRNVRKPVPNPSPTPRVQEEALALLDAGATNAALAEKAGVPYTREFAKSGEQRVVYRIDRERFRRGLRQATAIGGFFLRRATRASVGAWKVYEFRTGFDFSLTGKLGMTELGGVGTSEISFYNIGF